MLLAPAATSKPSATFPAATYKPSATTTTNGPKRVSFKDITATPPPPVRPVLAPTLPAPLRASQVAGISRQPVNVVSARHEQQQLQPQQAPRRPPPRSSARPRLTGSPAPAALASVEPATSRPTQAKEASAVGAGGPLDAILITANGQARSLPFTYSLARFLSSTVSPNGFWHTHHENGETIVTLEGEYVEFQAYAKARTVGGHATVIKSVAQDDWLDPDERAAAAATATEQFEPGPDAGKPSAGAKKVAPKVSPTAPKPHNQQVDTNSMIDELVGPKRASPTTATSPSTLGPTTASSTTISSGSGSAQDVREVDIPSRVSARSSEAITQAVGKRKKELAQSQAVSTPDERPPAQPPPKSAPQHPAASPTTQL
ncbi:hypothetical protein TWF481_002775 [Arthrobotrys musiformis]|uniref:Uncharacterized protein n=1 Tax=Arthrobotrys musiformis TaxID=47236 RepID=A0AAV9VRD8_9PEZI